MRTTKLKKRKRITKQNNFLSKLEALRINSKKIKQIQVKFIKTSKELCLT